MNDNKWIEFIKEFIKEFISRAVDSVTACLRNPQGSSVPWEGNGSIISIFCGGSPPYDMIGWILRCIPCIRDQKISRYSLGFWHFSEMGIEIIRKLESGYMLRRQNHLISVIPPFLSYLRKYICERGETIDPIFARGSVVSISSARCL